MGVRIARKHVSWYLQHSPQYSARRKTFNQLEDAAGQLGYIKQLSITDSHNEVLAA
jgi:tRNA-dihydrouridine synthase B